MRFVGRTQIVVVKAALASWVGIVHLGVRLLRSVNLAVGLWLR
jgi:hypothetical protein